MEIISNPSFYRSAFGENIFLIAAAESEIIELDIYDDSLTTVIGKKRLSGATQYNIDISNYAIRQFDVKPMEFTSSGFYKPQKRLIYSRLACGTLERTACFAAGLETLRAAMKLSKAPDLINITPTGRFEITTLIDNIQWLTSITLRNGSKIATLSLGNSDHSAELASLCIDMADIDKRLNAAGYGKLVDYTQMTVKLYHNVLSRSVEQTFNIVAGHPDDIELCWWNHYGQIDYHTFRKLKAEVKSEKETITTDDGVKMINEKSENYLNLVSEYADESTLGWLGEIIKSPAVWINSQAGYTPIDITTNKVTVGSQDMLRLEITASWKDKINYRNL